jgi:HK97 gp10 family phage protein
MASRFRQTFDFDSAFQNISKRIAQDMYTDVKESLSAAGTSNPGQPPAKDTGALLASIYQKVDHDIKRDVIVIGAEAPYAASLEFGTSKMSPRPFLRPMLNRLDIQRIKL